MEVSPSRDFNNDGYLDLLVNSDNTNSSYGRSRMFFSDGPPNWTFTEVTSTHAAGLLRPRSGSNDNGALERCAVAGDLNNDGYIDFLRNSSSRLEIYLNRGPLPGEGGYPSYSFGTTVSGNVQEPDFALWTNSVGNSNPPNGIPNGMNTEGIGFMDYDNDGDLDIWVENHNWGIDIYRNENIPLGTNSVFTHVTPGSGTALGLPQSATDGDYGSVTDFDDDGYIDGIARKRNEEDFFRNLGNGTFQPVSSGTNNFDEQAWNSNKGSVALYDYDNDGDYDLFWTDNDVNQIWQQQGVGTGVFQATAEPATSAGVTLPGSGSTYNNGIDGVACGDVDNDGDVDIFLGGGSGSDSWLFINETGEGANPPGVLRFSRNNLGINTGNENTEGCGFVDYDQDGDLDLYINIDGDNNQFWENQLNDQNYLFVEVLENVYGAIPDRPAIGANVVLKGDCGATVESGIREVNGGNGHGTQDPSLVHFGLPDGPDQEYVVEVHYPVLKADTNGDLVIDTTRIIARDFVTPSDLGAYQVYTITPQSAIDVFQPIITSSSVNNVLCTNDSAIITLSSSAAATYLWSNGATDQSIRVSDPGNYWVTVTYANGCLSTSDTVEVISQPPPSADVNILGDNVCFGESDGSATVIPTAGVGPFSYLWSNGDTTQTSTNLSAGLYTVVLTDSNLCQVKDTAIITSLDPLQISPVALTDPSCQGFSDGAIDISVTGGAFPYNYSWSNGSTDQDIFLLTEGVYEVIVVDDSACTDTASFELFDANCPPVAVNDADTTDEDTPIDISVLDNDSDQDQGLDTTSLTIITDPAHGTAVVNPDGSISYDPDSNYYGPDTLVYAICDLFVAPLCDTAVVFITVNPVNDPPVAVDDTTTTPEDTPVDIPVLSNDSDPDGSLDTSSVVIITPPSHGTPTVNPDGSITYNPDTNYYGQDTLTYAVCDDGIPTPSLCDTATVIITVTPVNDPPIAVDDTTTTLEDTPVDIPVLSNDSDPDGSLDTSSVVIITPPNHGTPTINPDGSITYDPDTNYFGPDTLVYAVCDNGVPSPVLCDTATVIITVTPVNDPPIAVNDTVTTDEDVPVNIPVLNNDNDPDGSLDISFRDRARFNR